MNWRLRCLLVLLGSMLVATPSRARTAVKQPKTVYDYFLLLPSRFFEIDNVKIKRSTWLYQSNRSVVDLKNDYLYMQGDGAQGSLHIALFRYKGTVLVAVKKEFEEGTLCFLRYKNGVWHWVTKQVMPVKYDSHNTYILPRYGTTIKVLRGNRFFDETTPSQRLYDIVWRNGRFEVKK